MCVPRELPTESILPAQKERADRRAHGAAHRLLWPAELVTKAQISTVTRWTQVDGRQPPKTRLLKSTFTQEVNQNE